MHASLLAAGLAFAVSLAPDPSTPQELLGKLAQTWSAIHDYRVDIDANELVGESWHSRKIRYSLLRPNRARMEILDGSSRGTALVWDGGDRIHVRPGGLLAFLRLSLALNDPRATSERGSTIFTPDFGKVLECFAAHAGDVRVSPGAELEGKATTALTFEHAPGPVCSNDSTTDVLVTRDVVTILAETGLPLRRERFEGERSVERWDLHNLQINQGLTASDF
jgi:hypothetical protein